MLRYTSEGSPYPNDMQLQPGSFFSLPQMPLPLASIMCSVGKPKGYGKLELRSADPHEKPTIESAILAHPEDRARAVEAMELAWFCMRSKAMKTLAHFLWPNENVLRRRASISEWIMRSCDSGYHPCGTVPMGADTDPAAAVDGYGRVRGMTGLWVADASIMPTIPSANTNVPSLMIGERFGEWFREGSL
jgi:choline dehydrogenase